MTFTLAPCPVSQPKADVCDILHLHAFRRWVKAGLVTELLKVLAKLLHKAQRLEVDTTLFLFDCSRM